MIPQPVVRVVEAARVWRRTFQRLQAVLAAIRALGGETLTPVQQEEVTKARKDLAAASLELAAVVDAFEKLFQQMVAAKRKQKKPMTWASVFKTVRTGLKVASDLNEAFSKIGQQQRSPVIEVEGEVVSSGKK